MNMLWQWYWIILNYFLVKHVFHLWQMVYVGVCYCFPLCWLTSSLEGLAVGCCSGSCSADAGTSRWQGRLCWWQSASRRTPGCARHSSDREPSPARREKHARLSKSIPFNIHNLLYLLASFLNLSLNLTWTIKKSKGLMHFIQNIFLKICQTPTKCVALLEVPSSFCWCKSSHPLVSSSEHRGCWCQHGRSSPHIPS